METNKKQKQFLKNFLLIYNIVLMVLKNKVLHLIQLLENFQMVLIILMKNLILQIEYFMIISINHHILPLLLVFISLCKIL